MSGLDEGWAARLGQLRRYRRGDLLAIEGEAGNSLFLVRSGRVEVLKGEVVFTHRGPGELLGEMSILDEAPRSASVRAAEEVEAYEIPQAAFLTLLHDRPQLFLSITRQIIARLRESDQHGLAILLAQERLARELELARELQASLLPDPLPAPPGYTLAAAYHPAREVGGDLYDVVPVSGGRLAILMADVWDKGLGAGINMAVARALIRSQLRRDPRPVKLPAALTSALSDCVPGGEFFITLFYGLLDPARHLLTYVRAGHDYPLLLRGQFVSKLDAPGRVIASLGLKGPMQETSLRLEPGDLLVLYSDGVTDAEDEDGPLGLTGLAALLQRLRGEVATVGLPGAVLSYLDGLRRDDDQALLVIERRE